MERPIMIDSDVLRDLVQRHLALLKEVEIAAKASLITCGFCGNCEEIPGGCPKKCGECTICDECPCYGCGASAERFQWQGVVEANKPTDTEVDNFIACITKTESV